VADTPEFEIRPMTDRKALDELLRLRWSDGTVSVRGKLVGVMDVEALGAYVEGRLQGVATWIVPRRTISSSSWTRSRRRI
jgi:hypothetical protein